MTSSNTTIYYETFISFLRLAINEELKYYIIILYRFGHEDDDIRERCRKEGYDHYEIELILEYAKDNYRRRFSLKRVLKKILFIK